MKMIKLTREDSSSVIFIVTKYIESVEPYSHPDGAYAYITMTSGRVYSVKQSMHTVIQLVNGQVANE